jgi:aldehyde dehydrogenase (NAD+)
MTAGISHLAMIAMTASNEKDKARIVYEARGVCLILGPWNFPFGLVMGPLAAAVAAGNCCIVKLTDLCPATAQVAAKIVKAAFEEKEVAVIEGGVDVATALLELPFNHIFTGNAVGKLIGGSGKHPSRTLGWRQVTVVVDSARTQARRRGSRGCLQSIGQVHLPDYVFVKEPQKTP